MFLDEEDFIAGMNNIAFCSLETDAKILCFCLMDNHVHFILQGREQLCLDFIQRYKHLYTLRHVRKYPGVSSEPVHIGMKRIDTEEYFLTAIAYVLRNPIAAGYPYLPDSYRWSSAGLYMMEPERMLAGLKCRNASTYKVHGLRELLKTHKRIPGNWLIIDDRLVWPGSYVDYIMVNKFFGHPKRYLYYLSSTQEASVADVMGITENIFIPEHDLKVKAVELAREMFRKESVTELDVSERLVLAKHLKKKYGSSYRQIARVVHLDYKYLQGL